MIMFSNNKTSAWLAQKSSEEVEALLKNARSKSSELKKLYHLRTEAVMKKREEILRQKQLTLEKKKRDIAVMKEKLTMEIMVYGLWQTQQDIEEGLSKLRSKTAKLQALKVQINFRKKVLEQIHHDKTVFFTTQKGKPLPIETLVENLMKLLEIPPALPIQTCMSSTKPIDLIGKRIKHKWLVDGKSVWFTGKILSLVPGSDSWFNVQYENEDDILSLNLVDDIENGDLVVM